MPSLGHSGNSAESADRHEHDFGHNDLDLAHDGRPSGSEFACGHWGRGLSTFAASQCMLNHPGLRHRAPPSRHRQRRPEPDQELPCRGLQYVAMFYNVTHDNMQIKQWVRRITLNGHTFRGYRQSQEIIRPSLQYVPLADCKKSDLLLKTSS